MSDIHSKISRVDQVNPAQALSQQEKSKKTGHQAFDQILAGQIKAGSQSEGSEKSGGLSEIQGSFSARHLSALSPAMPENLTQYTSQISDSLDLFERYATFLGDPDKNLKQSYGLLEQILAQTRSLADQFDQETGQSQSPDNEKQFSGIKAIINELLTTARVEQIKFDRGDYL